MKELNASEQNNADSITDLFFIPEIYITSICNQDCLFCSDPTNKRSYRQVTDPILEDIKRDLRELKKVSDNIKITGREATARKDFLEVLNYTKGVGFKTITIETNGQNFSNRSFTKRVLEAGANDFFISIHGHNSKLHDHLTRTPGSFQRTKEGILNLIKYQQRVDTNIVVTKVNYKYIPKIVDFLNKLKVSGITISFIIVEGNAKKNIDLVPKMATVIPQIKKTIKAGGMNIALNHFAPCLLGNLIIYSNWFKQQKKVVIDNPNYLITIEPKDWHDAKDKSCQGCRFDNVCFGLRKGYVEIYGFNELKPVAGKKIKDFKEILVLKDSLRKNL